MRNLGSGSSQRRKELWNVRRLGSIVCRLCIYIVAQLAFLTIAIIHTSTHPDLCLTRASPLFVHCLRMQLECTIVYVSHCSNLAYVTGEPIMEVVIAMDLVHWNNEIRDMGKTMITMNTSLHCDFQRRVQFPVTRMYRRQCSNNRAGRQSSCSASRC